MIVVLLLMLGAVCVVGLLQTVFRAAQPVTIKGAVLARGDNVDRQVPDPRRQGFRRGGSGGKGRVDESHRLFCADLKQAGKIGRTDDPAIPRYAVSAAGYYVVYKRPAGGGSHDAAR